MRRRGFIQAGLAATALSAAPARAMAPAPGTGEPAPRLFEVVTTLTIAETAAPLWLWLPLLSREGAGQKVIGRSFESEDPFRLKHDPGSGAEWLAMRWDRPGPRHLQVTERVATWERTPADRSPPLTPAERVRWTARRGSEADRRLARATARRIVGDSAEPEARLRAIYDWVVARTWRDAAVAGCGPGDTEAMLRDGRFGGKCADINGLIVCLARASGMPAREIYGVRLADSRRFASLGRSGEVSRAQHCRAEVWLDGHGWFAVDPADVRKAVLEEGLAVDSREIRALADDLFGGAEANWAGYNTAGSFHPDEAPRAPRFRFLMYPTAMTEQGERDSLDPATWAYRIEAREVTA